MKSYFKPLIFSIVIVIIVSGCYKDRKVRIKGELTNGSGKKIELFELTSNKIILLDSVTIDKASRFKFQVDINKPSFFQLKTDTRQSIFLICMPGEKISLSADYNDFQNTYQVSGSIETSILREFMKQYYFALKQKDKLLEIYNEGLANEEDVNKLNEKIKEEHLDIIDNIKKYSIKFIEKNKCHLSSIIVLYQELGPHDPILSPESDFEYFEMIDSCLSQKYPDLEIVQDFNRATVEMRERIKLKNSNQNKLFKGSKAPDIALPDPMGDTILLSSLKGKYVLVDFWASWSKSCRSQNKIYKEVYNKFNARNFTIYQVSLDKSKNAWLRAIDEDKVNWVQVSDLKFWNSYVVNLYNVYSIPANYLIDPEGIIIDRNIETSELKNKLEKFIK